MQTRIVLVLLMWLLVAGCRQEEAPRQEPESAAASAQAPPLRKILVTGAADVDSLRQRGIEPIVIEPDFVVVRLPEAEVRALAAAGLKVEPVREGDLVQRLVEVVVSDPQQKTLLADLGMDIWEVAGDTVLAQAFDSQIAAARQQGVQVRIVQTNVRNVVKQRRERDDAP